jgi:hypothetical protein
MEAPSNPYKTIVTYGLLFLGVVALYYLFNFLYGTSDIFTVQLLNVSTDATKIPATLPDIPSPLSGGEYSANIWVYITSFRNSSGLTTSRKHVFELQGKGFSTLVVALGADQSSLITRVETNDTIQVLTPAGITAFLATATEASASQGNPPVCDIPEIDLQRWIHLAVSINGRIMDVYMDGKLARSCILPDIPVASEAGNQGVYAGGFPGYVSGIKFRAYALTPDRVYAEYQAGPYSSSNFMTFIAEKFGIRLTLQKEQELLENSA